MRPCAAETDTNRHTHIHTRNAQAHLQSAPPTNARGLRRVVGREHGISDGDVDRPAAAVLPRRNRFIDRRLQLRLGTKDGATVPG